MAFLPVIWALAEVDEGLKADLAAKSHDKLGENLRATQTLDAFRELGFAFRGHCGQITNWLKEPVPLPYFCFLYLLLLIDLVLLSLGLVSLDFGRALTLLSFLAVLVTFLGLKNVAVAMSDPFGDDYSDFNIEGMLSTAVKNSKANLKDTRKPLGPSKPGKAMSTIKAHATLASYDKTLDPPIELGSADAAKRVAREHRRGSATIDVNDANIEQTRLSSIKGKYGDEGNGAPLL